MISLKQEALRLRVDEKFSIKQIASKLHVSRSTISTWVRGHTLPIEERQLRQSENGRKMGGQNRKEQGKESKFYHSLSSKTLSNPRKMRIAESAVLFRLALHGYNIHSPLFDGDRTDWIVENPITNYLSRIQVRWVRRGRHGLPLIQLRCYNGHSKRRRYTESECDIIVGYDLFTDTAYIFRFSDLKHLKSSVTITSESAERWDIIP